MAAAGLVSNIARQAPVQSADAVNQAGAVPPPQQLQDAVGSVNNAMKSLSLNLEFSIDPDSDRTIVKVIDQQTKEVLRQMPSKEMLEIAQALDRLQGLLVNQRA